MSTVLYIAPKLNHYKFLKIDKLAEHFEMDVLCGESEVLANGSSIRQIIVIKSEKSDFNANAFVYKYIKDNVSEYEIIIIPYEIKFIWLIIRVYLLRKAAGNKFRLISYNHPVPKSTNCLKQVIFTLISWFSYAILYDRIIFYTKYSCEWAVSKQLISSKKAFWANNTIDNTEVDKYYKYQYPPKGELAILFIGRLIPSKKVDILLKYYDSLKKELKDYERHLRLEIIGDGPQSELVKANADRDNSIFWHKTLTNEEEIAPIMSRCSIVFVPGASGLSINHAFAYGRPYMTLGSDNHGPEISYLGNQKNGLLLTGNFESNLEIIAELLLHRERLIELCDRARESGDLLSIYNWVDQMRYALNEEE